MSDQMNGGDIVVAEEITGGELAVLSPASRAEIDMQITTAKSYPRDIRRVKDQATSMVTLDEETAAGCFYALPRSGKKIEGPSIRMAEIILSCWGNIRAESRVIDVGARELTAEGRCWDLESNVAISVQVKRRITNRDGKRYNDDMITVTGNAACSIALRNAVFKVIPMVLTRGLFETAKETAIGKAETLGERIDKMVTHFSKMGVSEEQIGIAVQRRNIDEITRNDLGVLLGLATAIKDGDTTVDEAFPKPRATEEKKPAKAGEKSAELAGKLGGKKSEPKKTKPKADDHPTLAEEDEPKEQEPEQATEAAEETPETEEEEVAEESSEPEAKQEEAETPPSGDAALSRLAEIICDEIGIGITDDVMALVEKRCASMKQDPADVLANEGLYKIVAGKVRSQFGPKEGE